MNTTRFKILCILLWGGFTLPAWAGDTACYLKPGESLYYRLALTIPATFCAQSRNSEDASCRHLPKTPVVQLHGLWPNYEKGWPEGRCRKGQCVRSSTDAGRYCSYPTPPGLYASTAWRQLKGYMAGSQDCLERHEWIKHGTCSPMNPVGYFAWSLKATQKIGRGLALEPGQTYTRNEIDKRVRQNLPALDGALRFKCNRDQLAEINVFYAWSNPPDKPMATKSGRNSFGNCPSEFTIPNSKSR